MPIDNRVDTQPKLNKTEARQGRVVGDGRIAKILLTSLAALVVLGVLLFLIF